MGFFFDFGGYNCNHVAQQAFLVGTLCSSDLVVTHNSGFVFILSAYRPVLYNNHLDVDNADSIEWNYCPVCALELGNKFFNSFENTTKGVKTK